MKYFALLVFISFCFQTVIYSQEIYYLKGSTRKIEQLVGDYDRQFKKNTNNLTFSNYQIWGTDLGVPFQYKDKTYLLFGDIPGDIGFGVDRDPIAYTTDNNPEDGIDLTFITKSAKLYNPITIPGISQGAFEVPLDGIEVNNKMYIYHTTDHMTRSVLARSDDGGLSFKLIEDSISVDHFINISINKVKRSHFPNLPGQWDKVLVALGTGIFRKSAVYMYCQAEDSIEFKESIYYFSGLENQMPIWSKNEKDAVPVVDISCGGELSTAYNPLLEKWLILYACDNPRGILLRTADNPWGPFGNEQLIFDPWQDNGYCNFIHTNWNYSVCDSVQDPGREYQWGGEYAPYMFKDMSTIKDSLVTIYYTMSTWNPYTVVLMKSTLVIPNKTNAIAKKTLTTEKIKVYPNPTTGKIIISSAGFNCLSVFDIMGQTLIKNKNIKEIDLSSFPKGIYFIQLINNNMTKHIFKVFKSQ